MPESPNAMPRECRKTAIIVPIIVHSHHSCCHTVLLDLLDLRIHMLAYNLPAVQRLAQVLAVARHTKGVVHYGYHSSPGGYCRHARTFCSQGWA